MAKQLNVSLGFSADTSKAKKQIQDLQASLDNLIKSSVKTTGSGELAITKQLTEAQVAAGKLQTILSQSMNEKTGNLDLTRFSQSLNQSGLELGVLKKQLDSLGPAGQKAFVNLAQSIVAADVPLARTSKLITEMWTTMKNTVRWQLSSSMLHGVMGAYQSAMGYAKDLDRSLNDIRIVTGQSVDEMARFAEQANKAAKALSTTTTEYTNASLIYFQQGLSDAEVAERTEVTIKMANAAGVSAQTVSDQMTAVWNNFDNGSKSLEYYADVMTALGAATASSTDEISQGLQKFAAVAETVGLSYEYATAALATVTSETRESADVVGTAYKTLFARIQGLQQGDTLDDGTDLNKYSAALAKVGINIKDVNGDMKDMDTILNEMGARWQGLAKDQQLALAQTVAGVRQYTQLVALMDNWGTFQENLTIAYNSEGTLQKQADIYAESWEAARKRVKAATEDLFDSIIDEDFFIFILNGFEDVLNVLADFVDSMNGLPGILTLVASIMTRVFSNQIAESINNIAFGVKSLTGQTKESAEKLVQTASTMAQNINFDTGTQAGDREGQALQDRLVLQEQIKSVAANLTDEQRVQLSQVLEINDAYAQQAIEVAKVRDAASQAQQNAAAPIRKKVAESARSENGDVDQAKLATNLKIYQEAREAMLNMATAGAKAAESIKVIGNASKSDAKSIENMKKSVAQLTEHLTNVSRAGAAEKITILLKEFENGSRTLEDFQAELAKIVTVEDLLQDTSVEMSYNLEQALKGVAKTTAQEVEELANATMNLAIAEQNSTNANNAYRDSFENIKTSITNFKTALGTFGDNVTKTMQGLSSLASGMQGLLGAFNALKNPDLSFGEKMLQITMSLSMAIPSLIAGLKALNVEQLKKNKQDLISIANGAAELIEKGLLTTATWAETKAKNGSVIATKLQTAANWALQASMGPVLAGLLLLTAALVAFVAIVMGVVAISTKFVESQNAEAKAAADAAAAAENLASAYSDVKQEYDEMLSVMNRYESAREGLDSLAEGTQEYKEALDSANAAALELIRLGGLIKDQDYEITNGEIIIKEDSLKKAKNDKYAEMQSAYAASTMASANANKANAELEQTKLIRSNDTSTWDSAVHGIVGGFGAGMIAAMATGQIPLAIAGALAGGIIGAVNNQLRNDINNSIESKQLDDLVQRYDQIGEAAFDASELQKLGIDTANEEYIASLKKVVRETCQAADEIETAAELAATAILEQDDRFANSKDSAELYAASGEIYNQLYQDALKKYNDTNMTNAGIGTKEAKDLWDKYLQNSDLGNLRGIKATNFKADNTIDYEYYDSEGKKQPANIDLATMAAAVAAAEANDALAGSANTLLEVFNHLTKNGGEAAQALKDIIAYESVEDSTQNEFNALKTDFGALDDAGKYKYLHETFGGENKQLSTEELKALGYDSIVALKQGVEQAIAEGDKIWGSIGENLVGSAKTVFEKAFSDNIFEDFTAQQAQQVANMYQEVFGQGGTQAVSALDAVLRSSGDNTDELSVILSAIDWQTTNVFDLSKMLKEAGIETDGFIDELAKLIDLMKEGQNTGFEAAAEHYTNMKDMAKLKEGDSITEEQYKQLEAAGIDASQYFKLMGDGSYELKEAAEEFYQLVNEKSLDAFKSNIEAMYQEIGSVDGVMRRRDEDSIATNNINAAGEYNQSLVSDQLTFLEALGVELENLETYQQMVAEGQNISVEALQKIQKLVEENKNRWDELPESIQASAVELEKHQQALANSASTVDELNRLYAEQFITLEQYQEAVNEVMENEFEMEGLDPDAAEEVADAFRDMAEAGVEGMEALKNDEEAVKDATVRYMELNEAIEDIYDNYKDYTQVLKDVRNATSKADRAMAANTDSAKKLKVSMAGLLGTTEDMIDADFLAAINPKDFEAAANGNANAIERIRNQFIDLQAQIYNCEDEVDIFKQKLTELSDGAYIDLNTDPFLSKLIQAAVDAGQTAAEIEAMLSGFGIDADVTPFTEELWQATQQAQAAGQDIANATSFTTEVEQEQVENPRKVENPKFDEKVTVTHKYGWNQVTLNGGFGAISYPSIYAEAHKGVTTSVDTQEFSDTETVKGQTVKNGAGASGKGGVIVKNAHKAPAPSRTPSAGNTSRPPVSSGGGGGSSKEKEPSKPKKINYTKESDIVERYKEVNDALDNVADSMTRVQMEADILWGKNHINNLKEQNELIEKQIELLDRQYEEAKQYQEKDKIDLEKAASALSVSLVLDSETGDITNIEDVEEFIYRQLAAAEEHYNSLATGEEQEAYEETILEPLRQKIEDFETARDLYYDSIETAEDTLISKQEAELQKMANNFEMWSEGLEFEITFNENDLEIIEVLLNRMEDDVYQMAEAAALMTGIGGEGPGQLGTYLENLEMLDQQLVELERLYAGGEITEAAYYDGLDQIKEAMMENVASIQELDAAMMTYYGDTLVAAGEELARYTDLIDEQNSVLEHYLNLMNLMGKSTNYKEIGVILEGQAEIAENQAKISKEWYEARRTDATNAKAEYEEAIATGMSDEQVALLKEKWLAAEEVAADAQEKMLSDAETWAEALRAILENKLSEIGQTLENELTQGYGSFEAMTNALERANSLQEEYLTTTNQIYETNKLMRAAQQEIDKTSNTAAKRRLKNFIEETAQLQDQTKLSQYELDIQQAKYDLLLAEMALEDAQNAKSTVRLQRDAEGNIGYVYTADQNALSQAEQELEDAQNRLYNIGLEGANEYTEKYQQTLNEMYDTLTDIQQQYLDGAFETEEEYHKAMDEAKAYYYEKLQQYSSLYQVAITTDSRVVRDAWTTDFSDMIYKTDEWMQDVTSYVSDVSDAFKAWQEQISGPDGVEQLVGDSLGDISKNVKDVTDKSQELTDKVNNDVIPALNDEIEKVDTLTSEYVTLRESIYNVTQQHINQVKSINEATEAYYRLQAAQNAANNASQDTIIPNVPSSSPLPSSTKTLSQDEKSSTSNDNKENAINSSVQSTPKKTRWKAVYSLQGKSDSVLDKVTEQQAHDAAISVINNKVNSLTGLLMSEKTEIANSAYRSIKTSSYDTGGYTGSWGPYGKLAMLHEKELVLNKEETENFLASMEVLDKILKMIDLQSLNSQIGGLLNSPRLQEIQSQMLEQSVKIEAIFPGVSDRNELEEAFNNLINQASQYANRK